MLKLLSVLVVLLLTACEPRPPTSDQVRAQQQEQQTAQAVAQISMPVITNFQEMRMAKNVIEARDSTVTTYTYTQDMNGRFHKLCDSIGYGLPYATQFTNPQKIVHPYSSGNGALTLPQADPNGLYSPAQADGTWVMCLDPDSKKPKVVYVEPHVLVAPFPIKSAVD